MVYGLPNMALNVKSGARFKGNSVETWTQRTHPSSHISPKLLTPDIVDKIGRNVVFGYIERDFGDCEICSIRHCSDRLDVLLRQQYKESPESYGQCKNSFHFCDFSFLNFRFICLFIRLGF